jgi:dihydroneopterin aldolase
VGISNLRINCVIGVYPHERQDEQEIRVDIHVSTDFAACARSDLVKDAVNYEKLTSLCTKLAQSRRYRLLETFAWEFTEQVLKEFPIDWISIEIRKKNAIPDSDGAVVELVRRRGE